VHFFVRARRLILLIRRRVETRDALRDGDATGVVIDDDDVDASRVVWVYGRREANGALWWIAS